MRSEIYSHCSWLFTVNYVPYTVAVENNYRATSGKHGEGKLCPFFTNCYACNICGVMWKLNRSRVEILKKFPIPLPNYRTLKHRQFSEAFASAKQPRRLRGKANAFAKIASEVRRPSVYGETNAIPSARVSLITQEPEQIEKERWRGE